MEKDLFEIIVKSLTKCDEKTKQVMDIVYSVPKINYTPLNRCSCGKRYSPNLSSCPYCPTKIEDFIRCDSGHLKNKCNKSKQDRESIYSLEMVLKNMK
jgi:hypothetical protein